MSVVIRGARRLGHVDPALLSTCLSTPLCPARNPAPPLTCQHNRNYASKQVSHTQGGRAFGKIHSFEL